jgi:hypothetical protein
MQTTDIVMIRSGLGRGLSTVDHIKRPPEVCACPEHHSTAPAGSGAKSGTKAIGATKNWSSIKDHFPAAKNPTQPSGRKKRASRAKELEITTCAVCEKVAPPPKGKKLGLRLVGKRKVVKYVPLNSDDGFRPTYDKLGDDAADREGDKAARAESAHSKTTVPKVAKTAPPPRPTVAPKAVTVPAKVVERIREAPTVARQKSPEAPVEPPSPASSAIQTTVVPLPSFSKRPGGPLPEMPLTKKPNAAIVPPTKDNDLEEITPRKPIIKQESKTIVIDDDSDKEPTTKVKHEKSNSLQSDKKTRLEHQLRLLAIKKAKLLLDEETLQAEHELQALARSDGVKMER